MSNNFASGFIVATLLFGGIPGARWLWTKAAAELPTLSTCADAFTGDEMLQERLWVYRRLNQCRSELGHLEMIVP